MIEGEYTVYDLERSGDGVVCGNGDVVGIGIWRGID